MVILMEYFYQTRPPRTAGYSNLVHNRTLKVSLETNRMLTIKPLHVIMLGNIISLVVIPLGKWVISQKHRATITLGRIRVGTMGNVSVEEQNVSRLAGHRRKRHRGFGVGGDDTLGSEGYVGVMAPLARTHLGMVEKV